jgi:uncharacterized protein YdbL (DUF1318 family)
MLRPSRFFKAIRHASLATLLLIAGAGAGGALAQSQILDGPRTAGAVGERYDGFAVVRSGNNASVVESVNAERRKVYAERAAKEGVPADQIGRVYAGEILRSAPAGTWFLKEDGQWIRK